MIRILVLDDVPAEQLRAISGLLPTRPEFQDYLDQERRVALAEQVFCLQKEQVAGRALHWLREQPDQELPVDLVITDINLSELKDLPPDEMLVEASPQRGLVVALAVTKKYPGCQLIIFTNYLMENDRDLQLLELQPQTRAKNKASDIQTELEEMVREALREIARKRLSQLCQNNEFRRDLLREVQQIQGELATALKNITLPAPSTSLYHLMVGWAQASFDPEQKIAVLEYTDEAVQWLLNFLHAEPFVDTFNPAGKLRQNLHLFEQYLQHPKHPAWEAECNAASEELLLHLRKVVAEPDDCLIDQQLVKQVRDINISLLKGQVDWESPDSESRQRFFRLLCARRVILAIWAGKTVRAAQHFEGWEENNLVETAIKLALRRNPAERLSNATLRSQFYDYLGFQGSIIYPQRIETAGAAILPEEGAFLEHLYPLFRRG